MDHRVMHLKEDDHILTIASAGCNVLDYIIEGCKVTAVDFNSCQIALTELKKVAIINVDYETFFAIFGRSNMQLLREIYPSKLRPHLSAASAEFWDTGIHSIGSFMYSGTSGNMSYVLFRILFPLFGLGFVRRELLKTDDYKFGQPLSSQKNNNSSDNNSSSGTSQQQLQLLLTKNGYSIRAIAWLMDNILLRGGCCLAGVPERQMALGLHRPNNLAMVIERVFFATDLVEDNYFYAGYFLGHYTRRCCPRYLREENYDAMKRHLTAGKLHLVHGTLVSAIAANPASTPFTVASLLDHMDWMPDSMINEELTALFGKMDMSKGRVFWRSFADEDRVHASPLLWLKPERVDSSDDRVGMYWSTWVAETKTLNVDYVERNNASAALYSGLSIGQLYTGLKMVTFPFWKPLVMGSASSSSKVGNKHAKDMESFYKFQKEGYDNFREGLLHARPLLLEAFPLQKVQAAAPGTANGNGKNGKGAVVGKKMVWVDVGGGTARNLEFFSPEVLASHFEAIYIVDISASLLEMAQRRVDKMGLGSIVKVVELDVTLPLGPSLAAGLLPAAGTVDAVTMSYSYSMIPDKKAAVFNVGRLLRKGGHLCIADFFLKGNYDDCLSPLFRRLRAAESLFHKNWFAFDHVHLLEDKELEELGSSEDFEAVWDSRQRGAVPFLPFLRPYHGVYILCKK